MTLEWRTLDETELDHEKLWGAVLAAAAVVGLAVWPFVEVLPFRCVFKAVTGLPCLTCGSGRALLALMDGYLIEAARWNPMVPLGAVAAIAYGLYAAWVALTDSPRVRVRVGPSEARYIRWAAAVSATVLWSWLLVEGR